MTRECAQCSPYATPSGQRNHLVMLRLISPCLIAPLDFWIISIETLDEEVGDVAKTSGTVSVKNAELAARGTAAAHDNHPDVVAWGCSSRMT